MAKSKFRLQIHPEGFNQVRRDPRIQDDLDRRAEAIAAAAGGGDDFVAHSSPTSTRARSVVVTATIDGMLAEARDRALTNALDAGR